MNEIQKINICVSGWPGCGSSTLALLLAIILERSYLNIGSIYRYLGMKSGFSNEGNARPTFDKYVEEIIGTTVDNYSDYKLLNNDNLLLESDISAFRIGKHPKVFSIFLIANMEQRIKRVNLEGREDATNVLIKRDETLKEVYKTLWDIDFFDKSLIAEKYNYILDNTNLSIIGEIKEVFENLKEYNSFSYLENSYWDKIAERTEKYVDIFNDKGKEEILKLLKKENLLITAEDIITDIAKTFPEDVSQYPSNIKSYFLPNS